MANKLVQVAEATGVMTLIPIPTTGLLSKAGVTGIDAFAAGQLVNLATPALADAGTSLKADAYVIDAPSKTVGFNGIILGAITGLGATAGDECFLGAAGAVSLTPGTLIQSVGYAVNATDLLFIPGRPPL